MIWHFFTNKSGNWHETNWLLCTNVFFKPNNKAFLEKWYQGIKMEESLGLGKKSSGAKTDTETWLWFRLPIPKPGLGRTLMYSKASRYTASSYMDNDNAQLWIVSKKFEMDELM